MTENGHTCQAWNTQTPNVHDFNSDAYFTLDGSVNAVMNFCRDPGEKGWPWCYTTHVDIQKDVCNVTLCAGMLTLSILGKMSLDEIFKCVPCFCQKLDFEIRLKVSPLNIFAIFRKRQALTFHANHFP